jgi:hypothetical protein
MIIECSTLEQFKEIAEILSKRVYVLYLTSDNGAVLRPTVTSRGRDTVLLRNVSVEQQDELEKWWGRAFRCKTVHFKEDVML